MLNLCCWIYVYIYVDLLFCRLFLFAYSHYIHTLYTYIHYILFKTIKLVSFAIDYITLQYITLYSHTQLRACTYVYNMCITYK